MKTTLKHLVTVLKKETPELFTPTEKKIHALLRIADAGRDLPAHIRKTAERELRTGGWVDKEGQFTDRMPKIIIAHHT